MKSSSLSLCLHFRHLVPLSTSKQHCTPQQTLKRLRSITISVRLRQSFADQEINIFWNRRRNRLLPLTKVSDDPVLLQESIALLKLPPKEVDKYWHTKKCEWIDMKGEGYRLGLMNCHVCKQSMVKVIGGKCTLPGHKDITIAEKRKREWNAEAKKRAKEKPIVVSCTNCKCTAMLEPKTKKILDITKSKRCQVNGHQNLDPTHLCFNEHGVCDACNGLAGLIIFMVVCMFDSRSPTKHTHTCNLFVFRQSVRDAWMHA